MKSLRNYNRKTVLNESKRDDLLLPCLEKLKEKGVNATLGQLKTFMLRKLTEEGGIRNLSLGSNFYLAGAARYYFNGDLTNNKDLSVYKDDPTSKDDWKVDVCTKLNALINILRNAYIDTVGETFTEPEDFGTLTLARLLRKYNKAILKELGETTLDGDNQPQLDTNTRVGNGYTFDIIYSYPEATKYYEATDPGAWCITYGQNHYNSYIRSLNIHYVIFAKDGYENVPRQKGPGWTVRKPQDEFGCSLIAVLQSNKNGEPIYITSRWNHGHYSDESHCEADHAFTKEEFFAKTGVTDEDLQRIFKIWKQTSGNVGSLTKKEVKKEMLSALRALKYTQMKMNGGDISGALNVFDVVKNLSGPQDDVKLTKHILWCKTKASNGPIFYFLMDRGKIIFETLTEENIEVYYSDVPDNGHVHYMYERKSIAGYNGLIALVFHSYIKLYDTRRRKFIDIDGVSKFKSIPRCSTKKRGFYELVIATKDRALMSFSNNTPVRLPNGNFIFNAVKGSGHDGASTISNSRLDARLFPEAANGSLLEILYDESSGERFLYSTKLKTFVDFPKRSDGVELTLNSSYTGMESNYFTFYPYNNGRGWGWMPYFERDNCSLVDFTGKIVPVNGSEIISYSEACNGDYVMLYRLIDNGEKVSYVLNVRTGEVVNMPNGGQWNEHCHIENRGRIIFFRPDSNWINRNNYYIFDTKLNKFYENPFNYPSKYTFNVSSNGSVDGSGIIIKTKESNADRWSDREEFKRVSAIFTIPGTEEANERLVQDTWYSGMKMVYANQPINQNDIQTMVNEVVKRIFDNYLL